MAKISTYGIKSPPIGTDRVIGTDTVGPPINQTKNFSIQELGEYVTITYGSGEQSRVVELTPTEVAGLATTRKVLIAPQGTNTVIQLTGCSVWKEDDSVTGNPGYTFSGPTGIGIYYSSEPLSPSADSQTSGFFEFNNLNDSAANGKRGMLNTNNNNKVMHQNNGLDIFRNNDGDSPTLGGRVWVYIRYVIFNTEDYSIIGTTI